MSVDRVSISTGQRASPDELRGDVAQLGVGSLGGVRQDRERLVLGDLVPQPTSQMICSLDQVAIS